jgi:hypothetical protein
MVRASSDECSVLGEECKRAKVLVAAVPVGIIERRIGQHVIALEIFVLFAADRVGVLGGQPELGLEADIGGFVFSFDCLIFSLANACPVRSNYV